MEQQPAELALHVSAKTYFKIGNIPNNRQPREGGGALKSLQYMDSRLRGNDAPHRAGMKVNFEVGSNQYMYK